MSSEHSNFPASHIPTKLKNKSNHPTKYSTQQNEDITSFKNENVLFQIHTPTDNQTYNAKTFPAKFSINITNQSNELNSGAYNFNKQGHPMNNIHNAGIQHCYSNKNSNNNANNGNIKNKLRSLSTQNAMPYQQITHKRVSTGVITKNDIAYYEQALQQYREQYQQLIQQSEQNCNKYELCIEQLQTQLTACNSKMEQLYNENNEIAATCQQINKKQMSCQKQALAMMQRIKQSDVKYKQLEMKYKQKECRCKQLEYKYKQLQNKIKKREEKMRKMESRQLQKQQRQQKYKQQISSLEIVLKQKEQIIKKMNELRNQSHLQMLKQHQGMINCQSIKMQQWLASFHQSAANTYAQPSSGNSNNNRKSSSNELDQYSKLLQHNKSLLNDKQTLKLRIKDLSSKIKERDQHITKLQARQQKYKQYGMQLQQQLNRRNKQKNSTNNSSDSDKIEHRAQIIMKQIQSDGTVRVKMNLLLHQKDKRINALEQQLKNCKSEAVRLNNCIHKYQYLINDLQYSDKHSLLRIKSQTRFRCTSNDQGITQSNNSNSNNNNRDSKADDDKKRKPNYDGNSGYLASKICKQRTTHLVGGSNYTGQNGQVMTADIIEQNKLGRAKSIQQRHINSYNLK